MATKLSTPVGAVIFDVTLALFEPTMPLLVSVKTVTEQGHVVTEDGDFHDVNSVFKMPATLEDLAGVEACIAARARVISAVNHAFITTLSGVQNDGQ